VTLLVSPKEVDQQAVKMARDVNIVTLPAVGLQNRNYFSFGLSFMKSLSAARKVFAKNRPAAALAMGGFTSAPPILAARQLGARTFLHESNTIPGKANRWLSRFVDQCFVGFPQAGAQLRNRNVVTTGTPVRPQFQERDAATCRAALGLEANRPTVLVMGGSQGASGVNDLLMKALPTLTQQEPQLQFLHLTGPADAEKVRKAYAEKNLRAVVHAFFGEMELALGAATVAVSRSGASSLAELAAVRVPSLLIPFPAATDNHQFYNAKAFADTGAAQLLEQKSATADAVAKVILDLSANTAVRGQMQSALAKWHAPHAAEQIAETMLKLMAQRMKHTGASSHAAHAKGKCGCEKHRVELRANNTA
jgi:UDP-N-acetylglucosamine--N-acetylmuramyl-(pentapeptide) pyrophosphoryl-undecaprenol N-acetylglucosamine transferase